MTAEGMMPLGWDQTWGIRNARYYHADLGRIRRGEVKFMILREIFRRVQDETMSFTVEGDIHWGVNKIGVEKLRGGEDEKCGRRWLVWIFNNKGVTNFIDEASIIDHGQDAKVRVTGALGVKIARVRDVRDFPESNNQTIKQFL